MASAVHGSGRLQSLDGEREIGCNLRRFSPVYLETE